MCWRDTDGGEVVGGWESQVDQLASCSDSPKNCSLRLGVCSPAPTGWCPSVSPPGDEEALCEAELPP